MNRNTHRNALPPLIALLMIAAVIGSGHVLATDINWQVISSGGTDGTSTNFRLAGTICQTAVGVGSSTNYGLSHGYWQEYGNGGCCHIRGDVDHSGVLPIDIADLVYLTDYMFSGGPEPPCWDEGDIDASGIRPIDIADLVYLVDYMFTGGPAPPPCS